MNKNWAQGRHIVVLACGLLFTACSFQVLAEPLAELVHYRAADKTGLNGLWYKPETPGKTAVILVPQGTGGYTDADHNYAPLAEKITAAGYGFLLANMRTAGRNGWAWDNFETTEPDMIGTVDFVKSRGYTNIVLVGVSAGGPRAVYYWVRTKEPSIKAIAFMASITSPYLQGTLTHTKAEYAEYDKFLAKLRQMVKEGRGYEAVCWKVFGKMSECTPGEGNTLSAKSYLNIYGTLEDSNCSTVKFTPQLTLPAAVIHSKNDKLAHPGNAEQIYASLTSSSKRELIWVESAGHYLSGADAEIYAKAVVDRVQRTVPAK